MDPEDPNAEDYIKGLAGVKSFDDALSASEYALEMKRLGRIKKSEEELQKRIDDSSERLSISRLAKLMDRLDEIRGEENLIKSRINLIVANRKKAGEHSISTEPSEREEVGETSKTLNDDEESLPKAKLCVIPMNIPKKRRMAVMASGGTVDLEAEDHDDVEGNMAATSEEVFRDDGDESSYWDRVERWCKEHFAGINAIADFPRLKALFDSPLFDQSTQTIPCLVTVKCDEGPMVIPTFVYSKLLQYQRLGLQWMINLFRKNVGGILGDEMGLGKTIQVIAFIASVYASGEMLSPILIVCPATVMKQWVRELHTWVPFLRVILLHSSGYLGEQLGRALEVAKDKGHVIVTSYGHLQHPIVGQELLNTDFTAAILDEGHKIRNPLTEITVLCKLLKTPRRFILSGTPIQNNLIELWSLMDFVYPGLLGNMAVFKSEFSQPINAGGYANASSIQVQTSYRCACILKDMITPYLLRRVKADVAQDLPAKKEEVLFCQLTNYQRLLYERYIQSEDAQVILAGEKNLLAGIDILRKICNHPSLLHFDDDNIHGFEDIEVPTDEKDKSGKMAVLEAVIDGWHRGSHRVLLFAQTRQMLNIIEDRTQQLGYRYLRMDGTTPINERMIMVEEYNQNPEIFLFLLTTKVGGLGINLTGADRVIIYDPDWNPSTDMQARERAWRLGQTKPVTIYRMLTVGTIEEKIYHRQIFKQYLTNRILSDPKQARFFKSSDLYDLFSLSIPGEGGASETKSMLFGNEEGYSITETEEKIQSSSDRKVLSKDDQGNNILSDLMNVTGIHSAIEHDRLIERPKSETLLVEKEAKRRAAEAIEALQRSKSSSDKSNSIFAPSLGGSSSTAILAGIRRRLLAQDHCGGIRVPSSQESLQRVINDLMDYFDANKGRCSSDQIASKFNYVAGEDAVAFRQILRTVSSFSKISQLWILKSEYKNR